MIAFCFVLSFVFIFNSFPRLRKIRASFKEDALKHYTDILRPFFLKFYLAGFIPTILFICLVNFGKYDQVWYSWVFLATTLIWDLITTFTFARMINKSPFVSDYSSLHYVVTMMQVGRLLFLFALMNYKEIGSVHEV